MARVLVVEDDPATVEALVVCLQLEEFEVRAAPDVAAGVEILQQEPFDLILTDLFARSFSPEAFAPLDAFHAAAPDVPVVVATAHAAAGEIDPGRYDLADIVLKPFDIDDLMTRVRRALDCPQQQTRNLRSAADRTRERYCSTQQHLDASSELLRRITPPDSPPPAQ
jgi:DNA-binding NtrC family response regulator